MNPHIFYLCGDHQRPTGGQKHTYQHVDVLNRNGFSAYVVHGAPGFRLTWFDNETPVIDYAACVAMLDSERDFVVVSEDWAGFATELSARKVIFNKNIFNGFTILALSSSPYDPYRDPNVVAVLVVSAHNARQLRYAYPQLDVHQVMPDLHIERFSYVPLVRKCRQIAAIPKTRAVASVFQIFRARAAAGLLPGGDCEWVLLRDLHEREVADILARSLVFVFLSAEEGLGRMPLEAALSGCIVITYPNGPLRQLLPPDFCCDYADPVVVVRALESIVDAPPTRLEQMQAHVDAARDVARLYSAHAQAQTVCAAWETILRKARSSHAPRISGTR
jgi:hypothetical protein